MGKTDYAAVYRDIDFGAQPERYVIGCGEQGVLIAEPYKSEILPNWRFATPVSGNKYSGVKTIKAQDAGSETSVKAESARIFFKYYSLAKDDADYLKMKASHKQKSPR